MTYSVHEPDKQDWSLLKKELLRAAPSMGIDKIGIASADPFLDLKEILIRHRELGRESGFEEPDLEKRTHPELLMEGPRSIIAIAVAYPSKMSNPPKSEPDKYRGILSRSAWGEDYHHVLRRRLQRLEDWLKERVPDCRTEIMVDTGALSDRAVAERAGIGWSGKNCAIITPEFGSWVYLGEMITNIPLPPDQPILDECGECTICIDACPTGALVGPGQLHAGSCVSFLTQTKTVLPDHFKKKIGNRLYGCDTCQIVCPKNRGKNWTQHEELQPDPEVAKPLLKPMLTMSNKQFKEVFGTSSASWRGKKPLQRNAVIALGNFKDRSAVDLLGQLLVDDPRFEIREAAAWSLGEIAGEEAAAWIEKARNKEEQPEVLEALAKAMDKLTAAAEKEQTK